MANATVSRLGQIGAAGDTRALFLKVFSGEVLTTFNAKTVMKERVRTRNITSGKSASFPSIGRTVAAYHTPGTEITGNVIKHDEKVITIDDLLIAHTFISNIDEAMNHYDVRSEYSRQMGDALAQTYDRNLLSLAVKASRDTGAGGLGKGQADFGDAVSVTIGASPTTADIVAALYAAQVALDNKFIPEDQRYAYVSPAVYSALAQNDKLLNRDFGTPNGNYAEGNIRVVANFQLIKTPNLSLDHTAATATYPDYSNKYAVDASKTLVQIVVQEALGTVKLLDLASEMEYDIRRQGTLAVSKMAVGHGVIRPEGLYEIRKT